MDEKWQVSVEGDVVFMQRSWTGRGVYEASFVPVSGGGRRRIASAVVEADGKCCWSINYEYDLLMMELIISAVVLGEPAADLRAEFVELTARLPDGVIFPRAWCRQRSGIAFWIVSS
ncbi:hypothetical protein [Streptomyces sp. NPDC048560]|uniref:hypothetical protein n=1 Tax=Streptomyces sp. NPDC048560 TaxID=3155488 RepID=UPI0034357CCD